MVFLELRDAFPVAVDLYRLLPPIDSADDGRRGPDRVRVLQDGDLATAKPGGRLDGIEDGLVVRGADLGVQDVGFVVEKRLHEGGRGDNYGWIRRSGRMMPVDGSASSAERRQVAVRPCQAALSGSLGCGSSLLASSAPDVVNCKIKVV